VFDHYSAEESVADHHSAEESIADWERFADRLSADES
jgi:hypothetical protein